MVSRNFLCLLVLVVLSIHLCWRLTTASENVTEIRVQHKGVNILKISCHINNTLNRKHVKLTIFENTSNNTLVMVNNGNCPIIEASARAKHIYLRKHVSNEKLQSLDMLLLNYNPADNSGFGCNYTYLKDGDYYEHSLSFVSTAEITTSGEVNQTDSTNYATGEGTSTLTTSTSACKRPESDGSGSTANHHLVALLIICTLILLLMIIYLMFKGIRSRKKKATYTSKNEHDLSIEMKKAGDQDISKHKRSLLSKAPGRDVKDNMKGGK